MNRLKRAIDNLASYLNKDKKGLELLSQITRLANETRKELASRQIDLQRNSELMASYRHELLEQKNQNIKSQEDLRRLESKYRQCVLELKRLKTAASSDDNKISADLKKSVDTASWDDLLCLIFRMREYGKCGWIPDENKEQLNNIINNFSGGELLKLGVFVALYAKVFGAITITANRPNGEMSEKFSDAMLKWIRKQIDRSLEYKMLSQIVDDKAEPPSELIRDTAAATGELLNIFNRN